MIVARAFFPAKQSTSEARQPLDESQSFHGTFVAGVIGGVAGTTAPAGVPSTCVLSSGGCHPTVTGLSGVAPRVWLGNYRVFSLPAPLGGCCSANTPEIVAAFESAVADGMDVINFSGGGPQSDPDGDPFTQVVANVGEGRRRARDLGRQRPRAVRHGHRRLTVDRPRRNQRRRDVERPHLHERAHAVSPDELGQQPFVPNPGLLPATWSSSESDSSWTSARSPAPTGKPVDRQLLRRTPFPAGASLGSSPSSPEAAARSSRRALAPRRQAPPG